MGPAAIISNIVPYALLRIANIMKHCLRAPLLAPSPDWSLDTRALLALPAWEFTGDDLRICSSWEICHATHQMQHCIGLRAKSCLLFELRLCNNLVTQAQTVSYSKPGLGRLRTKHPIQNILTDSLYFRYDDIWTHHNNSTIQIWTFGHSSDSSVTLVTLV